MIPELNFCVYSLSKTFTKLKVGLPSNPSLFLEIFISRHRKARNSVTFGWSCHQKICVRLNLSIYQIYPLTMPQGTALLIVTTALSVIKFLLCKILHYVQIDTCDPYKTITRIPTKAFLTSSDSSFFFGAVVQMNDDEKRDLTPNTIGSISVVSSTATPSDSAAERQALGWKQETHDVQSREECPGTKGYLTVFGAFVSLLVTFGQMNAFGTFQAWYSSHQLASMSQSTISWIGSLQLLVFFLSVNIPYLNLQVQTLTKICRVHQLAVVLTHMDQPDSWSPGVYLLLWVWYSWAFRLHTGSIFLHRASSLVLG